MPSVYALLPLVLVVGLLVPACGRFQGLSGPSLHSSSGAVAPAVANPESEPSFSEESCAALRQERDLRPTDLAEIGQAERTAEISLKKNDLEQEIRDQQQALADRDTEIARLRKELAATWQSLSVVRDERKKQEQVAAQLVRKVRESVTRLMALENSNAALVDELHALQQRAAQTEARPLDSDPGGERRSP